MGAENTTEMFRNMLIATGVLIGTVFVLVLVGFVVYHKTAGDRHETDNAH
jgi:hypothetical protein